MGTAPEAVPPPEAGSVRYFVLLYTPRERGRALSTLLAIADELTTGLTRQLDHGVAHVRLEWWRQEAQREAAGAATHPWLRALRGAGAAPLELTPLIEAAAIDLASTYLSGEAERRLPRVRFLTAGRVLAPSGLSYADEERLERLGQWVDELESHADDAARRALVAAPPSISASHQPPLAPLLVWAALALSGARRRTRRTPGESGTMRLSPLDGFADNLIAWRAARRASAGQFRIDVK